MSLRQRLTDWWTSTRVCYGGPMDGQRVSCEREEIVPGVGVTWIPWKYYGWSSLGFLVDDLWACPDMEGIYTLNESRRQYEWKQLGRRSLSVLPPKGEK